LRLIDDVLDFARIEAGHISISLEPVTVSEVLADVRATLDPIAQRAEVALEFPSLAEDLPRVLADRTRFKQILLNYGSNAIKYGRQRGTVAFRVRQGEGSLSVSVLDDGVGIPIDKQDRIFMPFQRAGQETGSIEGTGIGLAISKHLAESMAGRVGFRSEPDQGSEFWIELPIAERAHVPDPREAREELSLFNGTGPRYSVVYIEDNPSNIAFMKDLLEAFDRVELLTAPTAELGLELVRTHLPNVVLMDIHLPGMNGLEALRRLKQWRETRDIPVVALSAAAVVRDAERVRQAGFHRYLTKPLKIDEFAKVLREVLQHGDTPPSASEGGAAPP
jgi:CheY-like chemotaxis protein